MKFCKYCQQEKEIDAFSVKASSLDGLQNRCKSCFSFYMKQRNAEKSKEINAKRRVAYAEQIEKKREQTRRSYAKHSEKRKAYVKAYVQKNQEKVSAYKYEYKKKRLLSDPLFALKHSMSTLLRVSLKVKGFSKTTKVAQTLGCTWAELKLHIERQFLPGMTWENRAKWHIDHIIPLATAKTEEDVVKLNHHTNLRPMWAQDNLRKSAKLESLL
jgi:hypothetical protein